MNNKDNIKLLHENYVWYLLWVFDFICDKLCSYCTANPSDLRNRLLWLNRNLNFRNVKKVILQVNWINPGDDFNSITLHQLYALLPWRFDSSAFKTIFVQTYFYIMGIHFHLWRWPWLVHMNWFIWIKSKIIYDFMFTSNALGFY